MFMCGFTKLFIKQNMRDSFCAGDSKIEMGFLLNRFISHSLSNLFDINGEFLLPSSMNRHLMKTLFISQIKASKMLILYRSIKNIGVLNNSKEDQAEFELIIKSSLKFLRNVIFFKNMDTNAFTNQKVSIFPSLEIEIQKSYLMRDHLIHIVTGSKPKRIKSVYFKKKSCQIDADPYYKIKLLLRNDQIVLGGFRIKWPKQYVNPMAIVMTINHILNTKYDLLNQIDEVLFRVFLVGQVLHYYSIVHSFQKILMFKSFIKNEKIMIEFLGSISPKNIYCLIPNDDGFHLISLFPVYQIGDDPSDEPSLYKSIIKRDEDIENYLCRIRDVSVYTKLVSVYNEINNGLPYRGFINSVKMRCNTIEGYNDKNLVFSIQINSRTMTPFIMFSHQIECEGDITLPYPPFISRNFPKDQYKPYFHHNSKGFGISLSKRTHFSFAPYLFVQFYQIIKKTFLSIKSMDEKDLYCTEIFDKSNQSIMCDNISKAMKKAKAMSIILQMHQQLSEKGVKSTYQKNVIRFSVPPFDRILFRITDKCIWSLKLWRPDIGIPAHSNSAIKITGTSVSMRFVDWVIHVITGLETFLLMMRQAYTVSLFHSSVKHFYYYDKLFFSFHHDLPYNSTLFSQFGPLEPYYRSRRSVSAFRVDSFCVPHVKCPFLRQIQLRKGSTSSKGDGSEINLSPFLCASLVPLAYIKDVFRCDNWSISMLKEDGSFFIIFRRKYSLNVLLRPSNSFQITIPLWGPSNILMIPMMILPMYCNTRRVSHPVMRLHLSQLLLIKESIEEFFLDIDLLKSLGYKKYKLEEPSLVFEKHPNLPSWIKPSVSIRQNSIEICFPINDVNDFHNSYSFSRSSKRASIGCVYRLYSHGPELLVAFSRAFTSDWTNNPIDWVQSFSTMGVIESFVTIDLITENRIFSARIWIDNGIKCAISLNGVDIDGITSIPKFTTYISNLGKE